MSELRSALLFSLLCRLLIITDIMDAAEQFKGSIIIEESNLAGWSQNVAP